MAHHVIAHVGWSVTDYGLGLIVFSNGFIVHLTVDLHQTDVIDITIDKSLEGKLLADIVDGESLQKFQRFHNFNLLVSQFAVLLICW